VILVMVLWSQFVIGGPIRCSLVRNFLIYYPDDPGAEMECKACPECPLGLGLVPQCGTKITNYTTIKCEPCQQNKTYSDKHGIESCRSCHDCGLTNVIQQCTPSQNRKCGTECPERHYLDDNGFCQECYFCCPSVDETGRMKKYVVYLGLRISAGLQPVKEKLEAVRKAPVPRDVSELRSFLGMIPYYHSFLPNLASTLAPLHELLKKGKAWVWIAECQKAYDACKEGLTSDYLLVHYDVTRELRLACDASSFGLGAVISHVMDDGRERPIAYASRTFFKFY
ncbi:Transposon Tf2-9 polyprotein, partial [Stylophora pistillata]